MRNPILTTDSYKVSHWKQYPPGTNTVFSFFESRGGEFDDVVFFGLQYFLSEYLQGSAVDLIDLNEAEQLYKKHFGSDLLNVEGWRTLILRHGGRLPLRIKAVPEGTVVPTGNVLMTVENTDPDFPWLTNWFETLLSQVWYPCTVATQSREMKKLILRYLEDTGDPSGIDFKLHDFGYRGSTSVESAGIGGAAHLVSFKGTDTIAALEVADYYYHEDMAGFSIPAAEHSTITSWGRENEVDAYRNMLEQYPTGLVAVVSDSYNIYKAVSELWGDKLKDQVLARDGTLVIRPDSGDPVFVLGVVLQLLADKFGYSTNVKGYKVLNPKVRVIQGDGIDYQMINKILYRLKETGWSADNLAFGSGGALLQKVNRDTLKFAFKCSAIKIGDEWRDVMKDPITDSGKKSKAGLLSLVKHNGKFVTCSESTRNFYAESKDELVTVFENGVLVKDWTFAEIRERAKV